MGRKPSITPEQGEALLEAYGRLGSIRAAAAEVGVSEDAAQRYAAKFPKSAAPVIAQQQYIVETAGASLFDTRAVLEENYGRIKKLADQLDQGIMLINGEYQALVPPATNVAAIKEIREHVETSMKLMKLLVDVDEVRKFQQAVLEAIGEADEPTKHRIIAKLRERRALGLTLSGS